MNRRNAPPRRRIMDRQQLIEATRTIRRLVRSKNTVGRKPKPTDDLPDDHTQTIHLRVGKAELVDLDKIVEAMKRDPKMGRMRLQPGREKAARYAITEYADQLAKTTTG